VETKGTKLANAASIPQSTISMGELEEKVPVEVKTIEMVALFKDELRRNKIESKEVTLCLSGRDLIIRTFEIPIIPREEIGSAINFEAKKYIPFKVEELIDDFQLKFDKSSHTNLVLFMGIKKETLDRYISILNQLNLRTSAIEYSAFSVLRCLQLSGLNDSGTIGTLATDLTGEDEVSFTVLENGFPLFSRDISLTGVPESIGRLKEAEPAEALEKLKTEIQVSLDYYNRKFPTKNIKKIFLICHPDNRSDLEAFIRETGLPSQFVNITKCLGKTAAYSLSSLKAYSASLSKTKRLKLTVNLLAAKDKIRALKERAAPKEIVPLLEGLRLDYKFILLGLLICLATYGYGYYKIQPLRKKLNDIIAKRVQVSTIGPTTTNEELIRIDAQYKGRLDSLDNLIKRQMYITEILNVISREAPQGLWLNNLSVRKKSEGQFELSLDGMVYLGDSDKEFKTVNKFLENLKQNPDYTKYFKQINFNSLDRKQIETSLAYGTNFVISCINYMEKE
jgi:Tfp pilus assembly PilM family ATPase